MTLTAGILDALLRGSNSYSPLPRLQVLPPPFLARLQVIPLRPFVPSVDKDKRFGRHTRTGIVLRNRQQSLLPSHSFAQPPLVNFRRGVHQKCGPFRSPRTVVPSGADARYPRILWLCFMQRGLHQSFVIIDTVFP